MKKYFVYKIPIQLKSSWKIIKYKVFVTKVILTSSLVKIYNSSEPGLAFYYGFKINEKIVLGTGAERDRFRIALQV